MNLPTIHDANREGLVLVWVDRWGLQSCGWDKVKEGQRWQRGSVFPERVKKQERQRGAWI